MFAIISPSGEILTTEETEGQAVQTGKRAAPKVFVDRSSLFDEREGNPPTAAQGPALAWRGVKKTRIEWRDVERLSLVDAHERMMKVFGKLRKHGSAVASYSTPAGMVDRLLGQNYKTSKEHPSHYVDVQGLSLLPNVAYTKLGGTQRINTCVGATRECRSACLVYSGRNEADPYNTRVKKARTEAFVSDPVAFGRILYEACKRHVGDSSGPGRPKRSGILPFIRLNVFSDVPWEMVFPELFERVPAQFYDYTKVPGRRVPSNYDLTFSYSGRNLNEVRHELQIGKRVAVVFFKHERPTEWKRTPGGFPAMFLGKKVIDGDSHDARPLDPKGVIVGLKYKPPRGAGIDQRNTVFVVPVHVVDGQIVAAVTPRSEPGVAENDVSEGARAANPIRRSLLR
jgi:hypothetical protein